MYNPLSLEDYKDKPITIRVLTQYIETEQRNIWMNDGFIFEQSKLQPLIGVAPGIHHHEGYCLFSSAEHGQFVLLKNPDKAFGDENDGAYANDPQTYCRYYLAQSITDKSCWKRVRVGQSSTITPSGHAETMALTKLQKLHGHLISGENEYILMPSPGIKLSTMWKDGILPLLNAGHMFHLIESLIKSFEEWLKQDLIHPSLSADDIELTDTGIEISGFKDALPLISPATTTTLLPPLSFTEQAWLPPRLFTYGMTNTAQEITISHRDMLYAVINHIAYICTGSFPQHVVRLNLLSNSAYQEMRGAALSTEPVIAQFSSIGLCPFYSQDRFVKMILALEQLYLLELSAPDSLDIMHPIIDEHRFKATNPELNSTTVHGLNVWETLFDREIDILISMIFVHDNAATVNLPSHFVQTKILCRFVKIHGFLTETWLKQYFIKKHSPFTPDLTARICTLIKEWQTPSHEASIWQEAINAGENDLGPNLLETLIAWRQPGMNTQVGDKNYSILHELVCQHIRSQNNTLLVLIHELLSAGADPYIANCDNWTPLMDIAAYGQPYLALLFMNAEVYSGFRDANGGWTAFHYAAHRKTDEAEAIKMLQVLARTASIDTTDKKGETALMLLVYMGKHSAALFASYNLGADAERFDHAGESATTRGLDLSVYAHIPADTFINYRLNLEELSLKLQNTLERTKIVLREKEQEKVSERQNAAFILNGFFPTMAPKRSALTSSEEGSSKKSKPNDTILSAISMLQSDDLDRSMDSGTELLQLLAILNFKKAPLYPTFVGGIELTVPGGYEIIHHEDQQNGWNCFDLAVGVTRQQMIAYALDNKHDLEFRKLLAPEISSAIALTVADLNNQEPSAESGTGAAASSESPEKKAEIEQIAASSSSTDSKKVKSQRSSISGLLPSTMRTPEVLETGHRYLKVDERAEVRAALTQCNAAIAPEQPNILNWQELEHFFKTDANRTAFPEAFTIYQNTMDTYFTPVSNALNELCCREDIYEAYVTQYYGNNGWVSFHAQLQNDQSTSMIDIVAKMLGAKIYTHLPGGRIYSTAADAESEIHIAYNGINHFMGLRAVAEMQPFLVTESIDDRPTLGSLGLFQAMTDHSHSPEQQGGIFVFPYTQDNLERLLHDLPLCDIYFLNVNGDDFDAQLLSCSFSRDSVTKPHVLVLLETAINQWALIFFKYKIETSQDLEHIYYFDPLGLPIKTGIQESLSVPIETLSATGAISPIDTGPWVIIAAKQILTDGTLPTISSIAAIRQQQEEILSTPVTTLGY